MLLQAIIVNQFSVCEAWWCDNTNPDGTVEFQHDLNCNMKPELVSQLTMHNASPRFEELRMVRFIAETS